MKEQKQLAVSEEVHRAVKVKAAQEGKSIGCVVAEAFGVKVLKKEDKGRGK